MNSLFLSTNITHLVKHLSRMLWFLETVSKSAVITLLQFYLVLLFTGKDSESTLRGVLIEAYFEQIFTIQYLNQLESQRSTLDDIPNGMAFISVRRHKNSPMTHVTATHESCRIHHEADDGNDELYMQHMQK